MGTAAAVKVQAQVQRPILTHGRRHVDTEPGALVVESLRAENRHRGTVVVLLAHFKTLAALHPLTLRPGHRYAKVSRRSGLLREALKPLLHHPQQRHQRPAHRLTLLVLARCRPSGVQASPRAGWILFSLEVVVVPPAASVTPSHPDHRVYLGPHVT